eukprot:7098476-Prymnesium_polylepis.1
METNEEFHSAQATHRLSIKSAGTTSARSVSLSRFSLHNAKSPASLSRTQRQISESAGIIITRGTRSGMHIAKQNQESSCGARRAHSRMASEGGEASS